MPVCVRIVTSGGINLNDVPGNILNGEAKHFIRSCDIFPKQPEVEAPGYLPDNVARAYVEATNAKNARLFSAACSTYRRTMELALKTFAPEVDAWMIEKRINKLASEHKITPALQDWAHQLRLDGNEAIHGDGEADENLAEQMHGLTSMLLVYLYTMPGQVNAIRAEAERAGS